MAKKEQPEEKATGGRGKQRQGRARTEDRPSTRTGGRGKQRES